MAENETNENENERDGTPAGETPEAVAPAVDEGEPTVAVGVEANEAQAEPAVEAPAVVEPAAEGVVAEDVPPADEAMIEVPERTPPAAGAVEAAAPENVDTETVEASLAPDVQPDVDAETPAVPAAEAAEEPAAETEPAPSVEPAPSFEPAPPVEPAPPAVAALAAPAVPAAPAQQSGPKPKRKRLPRPLRRQRPTPKRGGATGGARKPIVRLPKPEGERGRRNELQGTVVSAAMDKTIVVKVNTIKAHRRYLKVVRRSTKFHAHDERNQAKPGDVVRIVETRPLSKTKNWRLSEIVVAAK